MAGKEPTELRNQDRETIKKLVQVFLEIDSHILDLHKCSSQDFLHLNRLLPSYNQPFKALTETLDQYISYFEASDKQPFLMQFDLFSKSVQSLRSIYTDTIDDTHCKTQDLKEKADAIYFLIKNIQQNLNTLRFLADKSFKDLDPTGQNGEKSVPGSEIEGLNQRLTEDLERIKDRLAESLRKAKSELSNLIDQQKILEQAATRLELIDKYITGISSFGTEKSEEIRTLEKSFEANVSEIITNLQYEDIIRQKISHISQIHADLVHNLTRQEGPHSNLLIEQVNEIVLVQAAQLVHANKQYQNAISKIVNSFITLNNTIFKLSKLGKAIRKSLTLSEIPQQKTIRETLSDICNDIVIQCNRFVHLDIHQDTRHTYPRLDILAAGYNDAFNTLRASHKPLSKQSSSADILLSIVQQTNELRGIIKNLSAPCQCSEQRQVQLEKQKANLIRYYESLCNFLGNSTYYNFGSISAPDESGLKMARKIEKSIRNVKYYDLFDRTIRQILFKYSEISTLTGKASETPGDVRSKMEFLRTNYTMESEHLVHNFILNIENINLGDIDKNIFQEESAPENDEGLELF